jgi:spore maturation protein SpmA
MMEAMMDGIEKHAAFYHAYLPHDRSLIPVAIALCVIVVLWLGLYLVSSERDPQGAQDDARAVAALVSRPVSH